MISAIVIVKNEQNLLKTCLESLHWVDELIVCDNGSNDNSPQIAKKYTSKIYQIITDDFSKLRNEGMKKATGDWVLYVDADERVLKPLREEVQNIVTEPNTKSAYAISRRNIIFGQPVHYGPFWPDWVVRLFWRKDFKEYVGQVHEYPKFNGDLGYTKGSLLHLTHRDIDHIVLKSLEWSKIDAKLRLDANHPKMSSWRFLRILATEIFHQGILRKGFFNGTRGVMDSILQAFSMFITYVRLWQLQQSVSLAEKYQQIDKKLEEDDFKE